MKQRMTSIILLTTATITQANTDETQIMRLLNPTFEELQSEFVGGQVVCYKGLQDELIEKALDKHFHRIEFMNFLDEREGK